MPLGGSTRSNSLVDQSLDFLPQSEPASSPQITDNNRSVIDLGGVTTVDDRDIALDFQDRSQDASRGGTIIDGAVTVTESTRVTETTRVDNRDLRDQSVVINDNSVSTDAGAIAGAFDLGHAALDAAGDFTGRAASLVAEQADASIRLADDARALVDQAFVDIGGARELTSRLALDQSDLVSEVAGLAAGALRDSQVATLGFLRDQQSGLLGTVDAFLAQAGDVIGEIIGAGERSTLAAPDRAAAVLGRQDSAAKGVAVTVGGWIAAALVGAAAVALFRGRP